MKSYFRSKVLPKPEDIADMLAKDFIRYVEEMSRFREKFYIAISGGSTPNLLFDILATEYPRSINWELLHFFWVDERCVPPTHIESNYGNAMEKCFSKIAIPLSNIHPIFGNENPEQEAIRYTGEILSLVPCMGGFPVFDIILLGMGEDGHTASIFPGQEKLFESNSLVTVSENPISGQKRISLTGRVLNNSPEVIFLVTGSRKQNILEQILTNNPLAKHYPASLIRPVQGTLSWYIDKDAAGNLCM